jgi:hypothetical protein
MANELYRIYSSLDPVIKSGETADITVTQSLQQGAAQLLHESGPAVKVAVQGPQTEITESDISGVYPAPGSTDSPDDYLPHIALSRRTLPWERRGPKDGAPWLALLVISDADMLVPFNPIVALPGTATQPVVSVPPAVTPVPHPAPPPPPPVAAPPAAIRAATPQAEAAHPALEAAAAGAAAVGGGITRPPIMVSAGPITPTSMQVKDVAKSDAATHTQLLTIPGITDGAQVNVIAIPASKLKQILPAQDDLKLLCHVKEVVEDGVTTFTALVVSGRLPDAGDLSPDNPPQTHCALLVSLEHRDDVYTRLDKGGNISLIVLHSWTFIPSKGGDFREVCQMIGYRPNGGVLRFGNLPSPARAGGHPLSGGFDNLMDSSGYLLQPLEHTEAGDVVWRSPLRPFPPPPRSNGFAIRSDPEEFAGQPADAPLDYSHATAFELGKLLALADVGIREDLREVHMMFNIPTNFVAMSNIPPALQKPYWGIDEGQSLVQVEAQLNQSLENPWAMSGSQSMVGIQNTLGKGEIGGISAANVAAWQTAVATVVGTVSSPAGGLQVGQIDIATVSESTLAMQFPEVVNAGLARGN